MKIGSKKWIEKGLLELEKERKVGYVIFMNPLTLNKLIAEYYLKTKK